MLDGKMMYNHTLKCLRILCGDNKVGESGRTCHSVDKNRKGRECYKNHIAYNAKGNLTFNAAIMFQIYEHGFNIPDGYEGLWEKMGEQVANIYDIIAEQN